MEKMGPDLSELGALVDAGIFKKLLESCALGILEMAALDVVVQDPHPYNCAVCGTNEGRAAPCDFGECVGRSDKALRGSLKRLMQGYKSELNKWYSEKL